MNCRPYKLLGATDSEHILDFFTKIIHQWYKKWFTDEANLPTVSFTKSKNELHADNYEVSHYLIRYESKRNWYAIVDPSKFQLKLTENIYSNLVKNETEISEIRAGLTEDVTNTVLNDLIKQFELSGSSSRSNSNASGLVPVSTDSVLPDDIHAKGYGGASLCMCMKDEVFSFVFSNEYIEKVLSANDSSAKESGRHMVSLHTALNNETLHAQVQLGSANIPLSELTDLKIGDVIKLDRKISDTIKLVIQNTKYQFKVKLGKTNNRLAVEIDSAEAV